MVEKMKRALLPFYTMRCNVFEKRPVFKDGRTLFEETEKYSLIPCRVSVKTSLFGENATSDKENYLSVGKKVKIFVPPEFVIEPGSRVEVCLGNVKTWYAQCGKMSFYPSHNEVMAVIEKSFA